uniref:Peptidase S1 domain-containing protein n=1 Tax=Accipiter nisus TaxID=211598 RepID=A0A8B9MDE9_9AVES
ILLPAGDWLVEWSCSSCRVGRIPQQDSKPWNPPSGRQVYWHDRANSSARDISAEATLVLQDFQKYLSYETVYPNGTCTPTTVESDPPCKRHGEETVEAACVTQVADYGIDRWFSISGNHSLMNYPFSATVKISMDCMGMLKSEWHVLTATHCIHNSKDYVKGAKKIKVGFLTPVQGAGNRMEMGRLMPMGWIWGSNSVSVNYNYALWELCRPRWCLHMKLMAAPAAEEMAGKKNNFSGFDSDQLGKLVYCFCGMEDEMVHLICQHCDASLVHPALGGWKWLGSTMTNIAIRLTALKFAQICYWIKGDSKSCNTE